MEFFQPDLWTNFALKKSKVVMLFALFHHLRVLISTISWFLQPGLSLIFRSLTSSSWFVSIRASQAPLLHVLLISVGKISVVYSCIGNVLKIEFIAAKAQ